MNRLCCSDLRSTGNGQNSCDQTGKCSATYQVNSPFQNKTDRCTNLIYHETKALSSNFYGFLWKSWFLLFKLQNLKKYHYIAYGFKLDCWKILSINFCFYWDLSIIFRYNKNEIFEFTQEWRRTKWNPCEKSNPLRCFWQPCLHFCRLAGIPHRRNRKKNRRSRRCSIPMFPILLWQLEIIRPSILRSTWPIVHGFQ